MEDLIDIGVDAINPVQVSARYGSGKIETGIWSSFWEQ
jgi:hypothetical protein